MVDRVLHSLLSEHEMLYWRRRYSGLHGFVSDEGYVSLNGVVWEAKEARVSVFDRIYLHGDGLVEVMAGSEGRPLFCREHVARLYRSAALIRLPLPWTQAELCAELHAMAMRLPTGRSYLRLTVSAGTGLGMVRPAVAVQKIIYCLKLPPATAHSGCALQTMRRENTSLLGAKTPSYLETIVAVQDAQKAGYDDVLWLNEHGHVAEAATANIFFVAFSEGQLVCHTPHPEAGLLVGITAQQVDKILTANDIAVISRTIHHTETSDFVAAFLSSSVQGVRAVSRIDTRHYPTDNNALRKILPLLTETTHPVTTAAKLS